MTTLMTRNTLCLFILMLLSGCAAFNYGYTSRKARGKYLLVSAAERSFGYKRLQYNIGYHQRSELAAFIAERGYPQMIYEDQMTDSGRRVDAVTLFYAGQDSLFQFMEKKGCWCSPIKVFSRKLTDFEHKRLQATDASF